MKPGFLTSTLTADSRRDGVEASSFDRFGDFTLSGSLGVGTDAPVRSVHLQGRNAVFRMDRDVNSSAFLLVRTQQNNFSSIWKTFSLGVNATSPGNGEFLINDLGASVGGGGARRLTINDTGDFGLNTGTPFATLDVNNTNATPFLFAFRENGAPVIFSETEGNLVLESDLFLSQDSGGNANIAAFDLGNNVFDSLHLRTNGIGMLFSVDEDDDNPGQLTRFVFRDAGETLASLDRDGDLFIDGTVTENTNFDLAESFWKSDDTITAGDVVRVDPENPQAARLGASEADPTVLGVVSARPGFLLGGGAFSVNGLIRAWGPEVAAQFERERGELESLVLARQPEVLEGLNQALRESATQSREAGVSLGADLLKRAAAPDYKLTQVRQVIEGEALRLFFDRHFVKIALAGRVLVKVDASYGSIEIGDLLTSSATPGHAMRSDEALPGTILGKALQSHAGGPGVIMMFVMPR